MELTERKKQILLFAGIALAVFIGASYIDYSRRETVSLLDDTPVVFEGRSTEAYVPESFHPENTAVEYLVSKGYKDLAKSISCSFDRNESLANGDVIKYSCTYDRDLARSAKLKIADTEKTYTAENIRLYDPLDLFEGITVGWNVGQDGIFADVTEIRKLIDLHVRYSFDADETYDGDTILIKAEYDEEFLHENGLEHEGPDEKRITIGPKPVQVTAIEELDEDELTVIQNQAKSYFTGELLGCDFTARFHGQDIHIDNVSEPAVKQYFFDGDRFTIVFTLDVSDQDDWFSIFRTFEAYYSGIVYRYADGNVQLISKTRHACEFTGFLGFYQLKIQE